MGDVFFYPHFDLQEDEGSTGGTAQKGSVSLSARNVSTI